MEITSLLISLFILIFLVISSYSVGINSLKIMKINETYLSIIAGYSIIVIITISLFFLDFKIQFIRNIIFFIVIISFLFTLLKNFKINLIDFLDKILNQSPIYIFFLLTILFYGEQFYIFRGNHYDTLNYSSMSLLSMNFSYLEIGQLTSSKVNQFFKDASHLFLNDRPTISVLISLLYFPKLLDIFLVNYIFKIFFLIVVQQSSSYFICKLYSNLGKLKIFLFSNIFTFSFFTLYIFEIDAFSQLAAFGVSIIFFSIIVFNNFKKDSRNLIIFLSLISSAFFLIYPEQAVVYFVLMFFYLIYRDYRIFLKNLTLFTFLFLFLTLPSFQIYEFLFNQLVFSKSFAGDWWGYFGAFILGSQNIVLDENYVGIIKEISQNLDKLELIKFIYNSNSSQHGNLVFLNFLPSLVGVYYIDTLKNLNFILYLFISLILNFGIIFFVFKNIKYIISNSDNFSHFLKFLFFFYSFVFILLLVYSNFWFLIKIYFYFSFFIFLFTFFYLGLNFENQNIFQKYNFLLIICILIFPIYKYCNFNNGIGTYDSMPSVMNKYYKINYNLEIPKTMINSCDKIYIIERNKILDNFVAVKLLYYKKEFQFIDDNIEIKKCQI